MQHDFQYVSEEKVKAVKKGLLELIYEVQNIVRDEFTFQFHFVGSAARDMITQDMNSRNGFDFDMDLYVNIKENEYEPEEIRNIICNAINKVAYKYGYGQCKQSTRVMTIEHRNCWFPIVEYSCDFAIMRNWSDGSRKYIRFNRYQRVYTWEYQKEGYIKVPEKIRWIENNNLMEELYNYYIYKKDGNDNPHKKSRAIFAESVHEICQKNGYKSNLPQKSRR